MVKVRFAPSPTGKLHLGSARTAVFNWLYARHTGGKFVLRIEDTDLKRSDAACVDSIIKDMEWLGLDYDEFYKQSERFDIYRKYRDQLIAEGKAYYCTCTKDELIERNKARGIFDETTKYDCHCRGNQTKPEGSYVVRLNMGQERDIIFKDHVRTRIRVNTKELDDFVLWKSDDSPTYNFAVVIDDALMEITHILRGEDHITNTAKQTVLYEYLGFKQPEWGHLPMVFGKDRTPLSKRKGSTNIDSYRDSGYLPDAILNYIARLGWSHGNDELFTRDELISLYDILKLNKSNAVYDEEKLAWVNSKHMSMTDSAELVRLLDIYLSETNQTRLGLMSSDEWLIRCTDVLKERSFNLATLFDELKIYATDEITMDEKASAKLEKISGTPETVAAYEESKSLIASIEDFSDLSGIEEKLREIADKNAAKFGQLVQMLRIKLTGRSVSPDIITVISLLGEKCADRL